MSKTKLKTALSNIDAYWAKDALAQIEQDEKTINSLHEVNSELQEQVNTLTVENVSLKKELNSLKG